MLPFGIFWDSVLLQLPFLFWLMWQLPLFAGIKGVVDYKSYEDMKYAVSRSVIKRFN